MNIADTYSTFQVVEKSPEREQGGYKLTPRNTVSNYTAAERKFKKTPRLEVRFISLYWVVLLYSCNHLVSLLCPSLATLDWNYILLHKLLFLLVCLDIQKTVEYTTYKAYLCNSNYVYAVVRVL